MKSIVTVTEPAASYSLTTRAKVLAELQKINDTPADDTLIDTQIADASQAIPTWLNRPVIVQETVSELFWPDPNALNHRGGGWWGANFWSWRGFAGTEQEVLRLERYPVSSIYSVTLDGELIDPTEYRLDPRKGFLYRLDQSGFPWTWIVSQDVVVDYTGGYPLDAIPADLDRAARMYVIDAWSGASKDPRVKGETVYGAVSTQYLASGGRNAGDLPPDVQSLISSYRRQTFA